MDEMTSPGPMLEARATYPRELVAATDARHFAEQLLTEWGCDPLVESARLLVSELVVNAVLHAGTGAELVLRLDDDLLRVEVRDGNPAPIERREYSPYATTGRGLMILDALAHRWGVDETDDGSGKIVWFELATSREGDDP
jgi:anti-sigma regulatory factor (Ser/Thr protein kinase)